MNTSYDIEIPGEERIVYVRPVAVADLPREIREQAMGVDQIYAVHKADGERLALVKDRTMAFLLAREHDYAAVNVH
ncbi:MAG: DUF1150 family protein [Rhodobacteraceae bacterium]|jgi:hypothetical protein|nr:DUF1150 domain-containing protein [Alphaproteobacteria bacterium]MBT8476017.1 DUF1150 domain-containing protein [Alphaproteobacteria bacterium]NNF70843.1 DUF1150 family protein [Paracoccaceae bacterium]NNK67430.1 DUF1150 family protein [Paracoccaceae bacterium]